MEQNVESNILGFVIKMVAGIAVGFLFGGIDASSDGFSFMSIFTGVAMFLLVYFIGTLYGFCLRATSNYVIAIIAMVFLIALIVFVIGKMDETFSEFWNNVIGILMILGLIWLPVHDVRKLIALARAPESNQDTPV